MSALLDTIDIANVCAPYVPDMVPGRRLQVDGDILAYQFAGDTRMEAAASLGMVCDKIRFLKRSAGAENVVVHLTAEGSAKAGRYIIAKTKPYQGNRKANRKPGNWQYLRDKMMSDDFEFSVQVYKNIEADDAISTIQWRDPKNSVCASIDKDLRVCPGWHVDWKTGELAYLPYMSYRRVMLGEYYGTYNFWLQMLMGDAADNIPGLTRHPDYPRGIGSKTARHILGFCTDEDAAKTVVALYREAYPTDKWADYFVEQASLLWILTDPCEVSWLTLVTQVPGANEIHAAETRLRQRVKQAIKEAREIEEMGDSRLAGETASLARGELPTDRAGVD